MAKDGGNRKCAPDTVKGPVTGGVHVFKEKTARPDPMPKVHTTRRASSK